MSARRSNGPRESRARPSPRLICAQQFFRDLQHWIAANPRIAARIVRVVLEIARDPFGGIGKPERLRHDPDRRFSRRIDGEHRLIYRMDEAFLELISARYHYEN